MGETKKPSRLRKALRQFILGPISDYQFGYNPNNIDFGVTVNQASAMRFTAVYAAIKILSENIASLPRYVTKRTGDDWIPASGHPVSKLLNHPNSYIDDFSFWYSILANLEGYGNAFAIIEWSEGIPVALHPVAPSYVSIGMSEYNGKPCKIFRVNFPDPIFGKYNRTYFEWEMLHFMQFSLDGIQGIDPISYNSAAIGRGIATTAFSAEFYKKGGNIKGVLETDNNLGEEAYNNFMNHYKNAATNFETPLLEYGIKYKSIGISPVAAQLIQSETLSIQDIARIFSIPPHLLAEMSHSTFSNIEQQNIFFGSYSLRPLCKRLEQQLCTKLFGADEIDDYSIDFDLRGMMRGDNASRAAYLNTLVSGGIITPNEARTQENLPKLPGLDRVFAPLNMAQVDENGNIINNNKDNETKVLSE